MHFRCLVIAYRHETLFGCSRACTRCTFTEPLWVISENEIYRAILCRESLPRKKITQSARRQRHHSPKFSDARFPFDVPGLSVPNNPGEDGTSRPLVAPSERAHGRRACANTEGRATPPKGSPDNTKRAREYMVFRRRDSLLRVQARGFCRHAISTGPWRLLDYISAILLSHLRILGRPCREAASIGIALSFSAVADSLRSARRAWRVPRLLLSASEPAQLEDAGERMAMATYAFTYACLVSAQNLRKLANIVDKSNVVEFRCTSVHVKCDRSPRYGPIKERQKCSVTALVVFVRFV